MKAIILEDESRAASHLERMLLKVAPEIQIVAKIESVRDCLKYLREFQEPDVIFSDIQLADGLSFEVFKQIAVQCPIIFTTAYDNYAIEAFKINGIDYLLKPVEELRLKQSIDKAKRFSPGFMLDKILAVSSFTSIKNYKSRFLVKVGDKIKSIQTEDILVFYSSEKSTFLLTVDKHNYCIDYSLELLEPIIDPEKYFRINRKYIVSIAACTNIISWSNSRLRLKIDGISDSEIIVARERVADFKFWLDK